MVALGSLKTALVISHTFFHQLRFLLSYKNIFPAHMGVGRIFSSGDQKCEISI